MKKRYEKQHKKDRLQLETVFLPYLNNFLKELSKIILDYLPQIWCDQCQELKYVICLKHKKTYFLKMDEDNRFVINHSLKIRFITLLKDYFMTREFCDDNYIDLTDDVYDENLTYKILVIQFDEYGRLHITLYHNIIPGTESKLCEDDNKILQKIHDKEEEAYAKYKAYISTLKFDFSRFRDL